MPLTFRSSAVNGNVLYGFQAFVANGFHNGAGTKMERRWNEAETENERSRNGKQTENEREMNGKRTGSPYSVCITLG